MNSITFRIIQRQKMLILTRLEKFSKKIRCQPFRKGRQLQRKDVTGKSLEIHTSRHAGSLVQVNRVTRKNNRLADFSYNILSQFGPFKHSTSNKINQRVNSTPTKQRNIIKPFKDPPPVRKPQRKPAVTTKKEVSTKRPERFQNNKPRTTTPPDDDVISGQYQNSYANFMDGGLMDDDYAPYNYFFNDQYGGASGQASHEVTSNPRSQNSMAGNSNSNPGPRKQLKKDETCECMFWCPVGFTYRGSCQGNMAWLFDVQMSVCCLNRSNVRRAQRNSNRNPRQRMLWDD